jgi:NTE family protein
LRNQVSSLVDFGRLNGGEVRITIALTDIMTGELVLFDTHHGDRLSVDHLLASCGYLPEFEPLMISGRLLGDGGLSANAPIEALVGHEKPITCFVVDLFAREGDAPLDLETALARKSDLTFANQTWLRLEAFYREERLHAELEDARPNARKHANGVGAAVYYLSYRADPAEAGSEKLFDYSKRTIARRWQSGAADMDEALRLHLCGTDTSPVRLIPIRRAASADTGGRR